MNFLKVSQAIREHLKVEGKPIKFPELEAGIEVENEHPEFVHGNNANAARIALDHLKEKSDYYTLLKKYVEKE